MRWEQSSHRQLRSTKGNLDVGKDESLAIDSTSSVHLASSHYRRLVHWHVLRVRQGPNELKKCVLAVYVR
jgi:hypothetical protein